MMLNRSIEKASWAGFLIKFALLFAFSFWAFSPGGPWARALAAGGGDVPETQMGFPPIEPQRSLEAMAGNTSDYLFWQAVDIPYAILNFLALSAAIALALRATKLGATPLRFLLALPVIYLVCEFVENTLVAAFAGGWLTPSEPTVLIQQLATTLKLFSGFGSMGLALIGVVIAAIAAVFSLMKKKS